MKNKTQPRVARRHNRKKRPQPPVDSNLPPAFLRSPKWPPPGAPPPPSRCRARSPSLLSLSFALSHTNTHAYVCSRRHTLSLNLSLSLTHTHIRIRPSPSALVRVKFLTCAPARRSSDASFSTLHEGTPSSFSTSPSPPPPPLPIVVLHLLLRLFAAPTVVARAVVFFWSRHKRTYRESHECGGRSANSSLPPPSSLSISLSLLSAKVPLVLLECTTDVDPLLEDNAFVDSSSLSVSYGDGRRSTSSGAVSGSYPKMGRELVSLGRRRKNTP